MTHCTFPKRIAVIPRKIKAKPVSTKVEKLAIDAFELTIQQATTHFYGHGRRVASHRELLERVAINARTKLLNYIAELEGSERKSWRQIAREELRNPIRGTTKKEIQKELLDRLSR
jgi:hypothetical protein